MRKLFIFCAACLMGMSAMAQEMDAVKFVQNETTDWYLLTTKPKVTFDANHNPVISGKTYDLALSAVETTFGTAPEDIWYTVRTDGVAGNWNTICLENNITAIDGATFWTVTGQDATSFILDEVTEPEAGQGYLIRFTAAELKVKYGNETADAPVTASYDNPVQGTFKQIDFDQEGINELVGNYVVYQNQLCPVEGWVGLLAHRAYVVANLVPNNVPAQAPNRARAYMPKPKETPTDNPSLHHSINSSFKMIKDGHFVIVKDNKMFNAQGTLIN